MDIIDQQRKDYLVSKLRNRLNKQTGYIFWVEKKYKDIGLSWPFDGELDESYKELQKTWDLLLKILDGDKRVVDFIKR